MNVISKGWGKGSSFQIPPRLIERAPLAILIVLLIICMFGGGSARPDVPALLILRPYCVFALAVLLLLPVKREYGAVRIPLILISLLVALMGLQLIPLPPELWLSLPGRGRYAEAAVIAGMPQPWRPVSLVPDLTYNSMLATLPAFVGLVGFAALSSAQRRTLLLIVLVAVFVSAVVAVGQAAAGGGFLRLYAVTHQGAAIGLFANRNHQAALLAASFPLLLAWALLADRKTPFARAQPYLAGAAALAIIPLILATGSRAGMALMAIAIMLSAVIAPISRMYRSVSPRTRWISQAAVIVAVPALIAVTIFSGRALSLRRLFDLALEEEGRFRNLPTLIDMLKEFSPVGIGFGAFDPVFRGFERSEFLRSTFFNHAHNDLIEVVLSGGVLALALVIAFIVWWVRQAILSIKLPLQPDVALARAAFVFLVIMALASLVDYPLRTPILTLLAAFSFGWLGQLRSRGGGVSIVS